MNELKNILEQNLNDNFISAVLSNPRDEKLSAKVKVRPVLMKDTRVFQMETFRGNQAFHENLSADEACEKMLEAMENMKQMQLVTADAEFSVLISKKGKVTIKKKQKKAKMRPLDLNHNRKKQYILQEGVPVPFLQDLGVMTEEGKIVHARFDKFRQINRFLEFIEDILPQLDSGRELTILDFGCGSGRDSKYFLEKGYRVDAVDGSEEICKITREYVKIEVKKMLFSELSFVNKYEGIWACSSILHLSKDELQDVLYKMMRALKKEGYIYTSFKYGEYEGYREERYYTDFTENSFAAFIKDFSEIKIVEYWISKDVRPGRSEEKWLNLILQKSDIV